VAIALRQLRQICRSVPPATFQSLVVTLVLSRLDYGNAVRIGLLAYLVHRLTYHMRSADHITDALASLHWLRFPERIEYKVAVLTYKVRHENAPRYLDPLVPVADLPGRRTLHSAGTNHLLVPPVRLSTVWNTLSEDITSWRHAPHHSGGRLQNAYQTSDLSQPGTCTPIEDRPPTIRPNSITCICCAACCTTNPCTTNLQQIEASGVWASLVNSLHADW